MQDITVEIVQNDDIEACRELCSELMALQQAKATMHPENFNFMNFETRMKKSYEGAPERQVIIAKDKGTPIGYIFSVVNYVTEEERGAIPDWAPPSENSTGFYPDWLKLPQKIGCLNNLYLREQYRNSGLGTKLFEMSMAWLESAMEMDLIFVYISNGNDAALNFYLKHGFTFSHAVFDGFINAAYKRRG